METVFEHGEMVSICTACYNISNVIHWVQEVTGDLICCLPLSVSFCVCLLCLCPSAPLFLSMSRCPLFLVSLFEMNHFLCTDYSGRATVAMEME